MTINPQKLRNADYILLSTKFHQWLTLLGYSSLSIPVLTLAVNHFLQYQEQQHKIHLHELDATDATDFIQAVKDRGVSGAHINKQVQALQLFSRYLRETGQCDAGFHLRRVKEHPAIPTWLKEQEIQLLYAATGDSLLGIRDRAMLAVFYGCGLRLNEGASLVLSDIDRQQRRLHVRKGKQYRERLVPLADKNFTELCFYIDYGRPQLVC